MAASVFIAIVSAAIGQTTSVVHSGVRFTTDLQYPGRLAPDGAGGAYVTDPPTDRVLHYDAAGALIGTPVVIPEGAVGIAVYGANIFISRKDGQVGIYDAAFVEQGASPLAQPPIPLLPLTMPNDLAIHSVDGELYVADSESHQVLVYNATTFVFRTAWGMRGTGAGDFESPQAITINPDIDRVYVADADGYRVQVFDTNGMPKDSFGYRTLYFDLDGQVAWFARGEGVAVDSCGFIYVSDALMGTVRVFDPSGSELDLDPDPAIDHVPAISYGASPGVRLPCDIMIDGDKLFVASTGASAVEVYDVVCTPAPLLRSSSSTTTIAASRKVSRKQAAQQVRLLDTPYVIADAVASGDYASRYDLNHDRTVDVEDVALAVDAFGAGTVDLFTKGESDDPGAFRASTVEGPHLNADLAISCWRCHAMNDLPNGETSAEGQENLCLSCHSSANLALEVPIAVFDKGLSHPVGIPADQGDVLGPAPETLLSWHLDDEGDIRCGTCHDPHTSLNGDPYLRADTDRGQLCGECHAEEAQWQDSGHSDEEGEAFVHYDWSLPNRAGCRRCHSGNGYIDFSNGVPEADQRGEFRVHDCLVCHATHGTPQSEDLLRTFGDVEMPWGTPMTGLDANATCVACHNGRYEPNTGHLTPHYLLGGVMLQGVNGDDFGNTSLANSAHSSQVSCVDCHMAPTPADGNPGAGKVGAHTLNMDVHDPADPDFGFENVENACQSCHAGLTDFNRMARGDYDGNGTVDGVQDEVQGLLDLVFAEIHAKGAVFLGHYPYWSLAGLDPAGFCDGGIDDGQPCVADSDCDDVVVGDAAGSCMPADEPVVRSAIWNYEYVDNDASLGVHNTAYAVGLLQLTYEKLTGNVLPGAYLRYVPEGSVASVEYVGTDTCLTCHGALAVTGTDYSTFRRSGHPYKLNEIHDGQMPTYPFSTIVGALGMINDDDSDPLDPGAGTDNSLGTPLSYNDVSFVIGGYGWKSRWIDADGFIVTGTEVQYNLETMGMVAYHDNDVDKPYNCGNCHTTGWRHYTSEPGDTRNLNRQNNLPGMDGTFAAAGVQCEACHGAGSFHADAPSPANITRVATPRTTADFLAPDMAYGKAAACGDCHTRDGEKDYPTYVGGPGRIAASGGLIRHHEQNDELSGIDPDDVAGGATGPHRNLACVACHDPHTTTKYMDVSGDPPGLRKVCTDCHNPDGLGGKDYAITSGGMTGLDCTDCHMPQLTKSAVGHAAVGTGPITGDIKSHIFRIDLSATDQFTADGKFAYPRITGEFACKKCHNNVDAFDLAFPSIQVIHEPLSPLASFGGCAQCHVSRPADHVGMQDVDACGLCHVPYGNTTSPPHDATTTGCIVCHTTPEETHTYLRDDSDQTIFAPGAEAECIACHRDGGFEPNGRAMPPLDSDAAILSALDQGTLRSWLQPGGFMAKYMSATQVVDTTDWIDTLTNNRTLAYDPYLDASFIPTDFALNGLGDNPAWAGATEHTVAVTPTIFTATNQVKLKALYSNDYLYVRAEWLDSTLSMTRGAWIFDPGTEAWRHPAAANQYEKQSEDRFSIIWNLTAPDFKDRRGCAIKCHGNVPGSSEYTDLAGSTADIWHSKAGRGLGLYSATDNGALTVQTADESYELTAGTATFSGVVDDKWLIWYMDTADGYGTEDSGRRGDAGSSAYSHNRNGTKSSPVWIETAPTSWADAMVLTQVEIDGGEAIDADPASGGYDAVAVAAAWANYVALDAVVPERVLRVPTGSRADVEHAATWSDGVWVNEFKRKLLTGPGNTDDVQFDLLSATEYEFSLAVFDNCGRGEIPPGHTTYGDGQYQVLRFLP